MLCTHQNSYNLIFRNSRRRKVQKTLPKDEFFHVNVVDKSTNKNKPRTRERERERTVTNLRVSEASYYTHNERPLSRHQEIVLQNVIDYVSEAVKKVFRYKLCEILHHESFNKKSF